MMTYKQNVSAIFFFAFCLFNSCLGTVTPEHAKELDTIIASIADQENQDAESSLDKACSISQDRVAAFKEEYRTSISRMNKLQKVAKGAFTLGAIYATYYVGSGLFHWIFGSEPAVSAVPVEDLAKEVAVLKRYLPNNGFFVSQFKNIGSILVSSYVAGLFAQIYLFTSQSIPERQLKLLEADFQRNIFLFSYALDQLVLYQTSSSVSDLVFNQNYKAVNPLCGKMVNLCERYIALLEILNESLPETLLIEQKLENVPTYLTSLSNKIFIDMNDSMKTLSINPQDAVAVSAMKSRLELLRTEIVAACGRMLLLLSAD